MSKRTGKTALITGASAGLGADFAQLFAADGHDVILVARRKDKLDALAAKLAEKHGIEAHVIASDLSEAAAPQALFDEVKAKEVVVTYLVNNAGFGHFAPLVDMDVENFEAVFRTNVTGAMLMAREASRHFIDQGSGNIVNISSTSGLRGAPNASASSASKFALRGMDDGWRAELRPHNVRVLLVNPSEVLTEFASAAGYAQEASPKKLRADEIASAVVGALEMDDRGFIPELSVWATNPF